MLVSLSLSPGYRLKVTRASRMSELADRVLTSLTAIGGSAAFLEVLRRWLQRRQGKRQEQLQLDVRCISCRLTSLCRSRKIPRTNNN